MQITLITQDEYDLLLQIQKEHSILTFQNKGYEYIDQSKFTDTDISAFHNVTKILGKAILGFKKFNNFCHSKNNELRIRFQYNWTADGTSGIPFDGVGYLFVDELLNGFREKEICELK